MGNDQVSQLIDKLTSALSGNRGAELIFGETRVVGERAVIPVAKIGYGFGGGGGSGKTQVAEETGEGAGFGGGINVKPIGFIEITPDKVEYKPIVDVAALAGTAAALVSFIALKAMLFSWRRRSWRLKQRHHLTHAEAHKKAA